jgi:NADH:ubiquinone oxidoreductase subunit H
MATDLPSLVNYVFAPLVKIGILLFGLMTAAAYFVLLERWMAAWVQDRLGPNRVGIPLTKIKLFGLGQPLADGIKFITKEEYTPAHVDKPLYLIAPISILAAALATFAVIPFGSVLPPISQIPGLDQAPIPLLVAPGVDVGMVYVFALSSIAVYGVILGGWASNNKYSFLGGLRSSAQLISYEIPMGLGILGVVLVSGSLRLDTIINEQATTGIWNCFLQPLGLVVFVIAAFAEAARLPFDLPEAEQELIGGYHTEYAGLNVISGGRVFAHDHGSLFDCDSVFRRLALVGRHRRRRGNDHLDPGDTTDHRFFGEDFWRDLILHAGPVELAAVSLRPTDGARVESADAAGFGESGSRGGDGGVWRDAPFAVRQ